MAKVWLMKSEPEVYSIDQLKKDGSTWWTGIRNYQARNFMMKDMQFGDWVVFYHSNSEPPGIAGLAKVSALAQPDEDQFNKKSEYFDPKATREKPIWFCVQVNFQEKWKHFVSLEEIREHKNLSEMLVLKRGQRLSIQPVTLKEFETLRQLGQG